MKKNSAKTSIILCALFFGMSIIFSASGQNRESIKPVKKGIFEKISQKNKLENHAVKSEYFPQIYKSTNNSYPKEINHFYWDVTTIWMADYNYFVNYDNHGNILSQFIVIANTNDTTGRIVNTYDNEQRLTEALVQNWNNGNWENTFRNVYTYDNQGNQLVSLGQMWQYPNWVTTYGSKYDYTYNQNNNITEEITQNWDSGNLSWINNYKDIYTYDANGYLIETISQYWDINTSIWMSSYKEIYTNDAGGVPAEAISQDWDEISNMWVNEEKFIDIVWHDWTGDPYESDLESLTSLEWASGIWENSYRVNYTYDSFGGYVEIEEEYFNGNWENAYRYSDMYDAHGNELGYTDEYWDNGVWKMSYGDKYILTYNGIDLVERIYQYWNTGLESFENSWKEEYSNFVTMESVEKNVISLASINLFPNPASEILNLEVKNMAFENLSIEITNVNGQRIYFRQYNQAGQFENSIDVSDYAKGIYFIKVQNAEETKVKKVVIQ